MADVFDSFTKLEPQAQETQGAEGQVTEGNAGQSTDTSGEIPNESQSQGTQDEGQQQANNPDEFFTTLNTRYGTQYKADEEIKSLFELPKRVTEYEEKLKDYDGTKKSLDQIKQDLEDARRVEAEKYLSDPIMQKAWVVKELKAKYPNSDVSVLTDLAMSDIDKMDDLDVLAREIKMKLPSRSLDSIKSVILDEIGADASIDPKEWDEKALTKLAIKASSARENVKTLLGGIQVPKVESKEDYQKRVSTELAKKQESVKPHKENYLKFDKYVIKDGLDYTVPEEFKSKLSEMFEAYASGMNYDLSPESIETLTEVRDATFFSQYKDKIYDVMYKDAESKVKAVWDKKFGNTETPNTATASDATDTNTMSNGMNFVNDMKSRGRVTKW